VFGALIVIGIATAAIILTQAFSILHAILIGVAVFILWFITRPYFRAVPPWPAAPRIERLGGRLDVAELSWMAFTRDGKVTTKVVQRVRNVASRRLAVHGVLWNGQPTFKNAEADPLAAWGTGPEDATEHRQRAAELLGFKMVNSLCAATEISPRILESWINALDNLAVTPTTGASHDR